MSALDKKLLRDIWRLRGQVLAIALVVSCGVATIAMSLGALNSLEETRSAYYERNRFAQVFASVKRAPDGLAARIAAIPGVKRVETRIVEEVTLDVPGMAEPATGRLVSIPPDHQPVLNNLTIVRGRYIAPGAPDEALIGKPFAEAHGFEPGDHLFGIINGRKRKLKIVGIALSPEYIYAIGRGAFVPDDRRFGLLWMSREALAAAYDLDEAFNDVTLSLLRGASAPAVIAALDAVLEPYGGFAAYDRDDQFSHAYLNNEMETMRSIARIVPPIFLAVAGFLLNIVVARLIDLEREQVGVLKACGYSNWAIGWHYAKFVLIVLALGLLIGFLAGAFLGRTITGIYAHFFQFPFLHYRPGAAVFAIAGLATLGAAALGTWGAVRRAVKLPAAEAMRPAPPATYRRTAIGRALIGLLAPLSRMVLRYVRRWPLRSALTVVGIALSVGILVTALFFFDTVDRMVETYYYGAQRQQVTVTFVEPHSDRVLQELAHLPGVLAVEPYRAVAARLRLGHRVERQAIQGLVPNGDLHRVLDGDERPVPVPAEGIVLSTKLAELLGAGRGDRVTVEVLEGRRPVREVPVTALVEEALGTPAYMQRSTLHQMMGEAPVVSGAYLQIDSLRADALYQRLKETPTVGAIILQSAALETFRATMAETMYISVTFYVVFATLIAIGVVYNSARIGLSERAREMASLRVLGFTRFEVSSILLGELALLTLLAMPLGCLIGRGIAWIMVQSFDTKLFRIPFVIEPSTYGFAVSIVLAAAIASGAIVRRRIDTLDLIAVLKTRE